MANRDRHKTPLESFNQTVLTMFKEAVENHDPSRDSLIFTVTNAIQMTLFRKKVDTILAKPLIEDQIELQLDRMFRIIIESNDFELFKSAIHFLTVTVSHNTSMLAGIIEDSMWKTVTSDPVYFRDPQVKREVERIRFALRHGGREFTRILQLGQSIDKLRSKTNANPSKLDEDNRNVLELYANMLLSRLSFMTIAGLLFQLRQGRLDNSAVNAYLNELWHHTTPDDSNAIIVNVPPVPTDTLWLTLLYMYGGMNSGIWADRYNFEDFHGTTKYVIQSYLLLLAKIAAPITIPSDSEIGTYAQLELWNELGELYELARDFLSATTSSDFTRELAELETLRLDDFLMRNRPRKPDETRTWMEQLNNIIQKASGRLSEVQVLAETLLPLDPLKSDQCEAQIRKAYEATSLVGEVASPTSCRPPARLDSLKSFPNRLPPVPKDCLLRVANVDCSMIWREIGDRIAWQETRYIYDTASNLKPPSAVCEKYDQEQIFEVIANETTKMIETNANPSLAFVPLKLVSDWQMHFKLRYELDQSYLTFPKAKLRLVHSWKGFEFQDIVIIDKTKCQWLYQEFNGSRLGCSLSLMGPEERKVKIEAESRGLLVPRAEAVALVKLHDLPRL